MAAKGSGGRASSPNFPLGRDMPVNIPGLPQPNMGTTQDFVNAVIPAGTTPGVQATQNQATSNALKGNKK